MTKENVSRRRTNAMFGCVDFPVHSEDFQSSGEGGMFVKLVVIDDREYDKSDWTICCGPAVNDWYGESWVGDDQVPTPQLDFREGASTEEALKAMQAHRVAYRAWVERIYPHYFEEGTENQYLSRDLVASMVLGNTGWSGYNNSSTGSYWTCTYADLTVAGKMLYQAVKGLYPGCSLHLLTFLDT